MARRISLGEGERLASQGEGAAPTMLDLFVSGYDRVKFEAHPLTGEDVISTHSSWKLNHSHGDVDPSTGALISYLPDPPCILPFEDEDGIRLDKNTAFEFEKVDQYWKNFASWIEYWPGLKEYRETQQEFRNLWLNRPPDSRIRGYVVMCSSSVGVRYQAASGDDLRNGQVLRSGQCVAVEQSELKDGVRYLKLPGPGAGWVFETKDGQQVMHEMHNTEAGMWWYKVTSPCPVETRRSPTIDDSMRTGFVLNSREVVVVNIRCKINGLTFFHLYDGRGWVFELKPGTLKNDRHIDNIVMGLCEDEFVDGEEASMLASLVPPTNQVVEVGLWTYIVNMEPVMAIGSKRNGHFLAPGAVVKVDKRCNSNGNPPGESGLQNVRSRRWLRLANGDGWVPECDDRGKKLMIVQANDEVSFPKWFRPGQDPNKAAESWMVGLV